MSDIIVARILFHIEYLGSYTDCNLNNIDLLQLIIAWHILLLAFYASRLNANE